MWQNWCSEIASYLCFLASRILTTDQEVANGAVHYSPRVVVVLEYHSSEVTISQFTAALKMSTLSFPTTAAACVLVQHNERWFYCVLVWVHVPAVFIVIIALYRSPLGVIQWWLIDRCIHVRHPCNPPSKSPDYGPATTRRPKHCSGVRTVYSGCIWPLHFVARNFWIFITGCSFKSPRWSDVICSYICTFRILFKIHCKTFLVGWPNWYEANGLCQMSTTASDENFSSLAVV